MLRASSNIIKGPGPTASRISYAPIFQAPGRHTGLGKRDAQVADVLQAISGAPVAAMDDQGHGVRPGALGGAQFPKLMLARGVVDLVAVGRRGKLEKAW